MQEKRSGFVRGQLVLVRTSVPTFVMATRVAQIRPLMAVTAIAAIVTKEWISRTARDDIVAAVGVGAVLGYSM